MQLLGPICVKHAVTKAGECGLDICEEDIMKTCKVSDVKCAGLSICDPETPAVVKDTTCLSEILNSFSHNLNVNYAVKTKDGKLSGIITIEHLKESLQFLELSEGLMALDIQETSPCTCHADMFIPEVLELFEKYDTEALPVTDGNNNVIGIIEKPIIDHYLRSQVMALHQKIASLG